MPVEIEKKVLLKNKEKSISLCVDHRPAHGIDDLDDMMIELIEDGSGYGMDERPSRSVSFRVTREDLLRFVDEIKALIEELPPQVESKTLEA